MLLFWFGTAAFAYALNHIAWEVMWEKRVAPEERRPWYMWMWELFYRFGLAPIAAIIDFWNDEKERREDW